MRLGTREVQLTHDELVGLLALAEATVHIGSGPGAPKVGYVSVLQPELQLTLEEASHARDLRASLEVLLELGVPGSFSVGKVRLSRSELEGTLKVLNALGSV